MAFLAEEDGQTAGGAGDGYAESFFRLQNELSSMQERISALSSQLQPQLWKLSDVLAAADKAKAESDELRATVTVLQRKLEDKDKEFEDKIAALEKKAEEAKAEEDAIPDEAVTQDELDEALRSLPAPDAEPTVPFTITLDSSGDTDKVVMFLPPGSITYKSADVPVDDTDEETMLLDITELMGETVYCHVVDEDGAVSAYVDNTPDAGENEVCVFPVADLEDLELSADEVTDLSDIILVHGSVIVPQVADDQEVNDGALIFQNEDGEEIERFTANQAGDTTVTIPTYEAGIPIEGNAPTVLGDNQQIVAMRYDKDDTHSLQVKVRGLGVDNNRVVSVTPASDWLTITNGTAVAHSTEV